MPPDNELAELSGGQAFIEFPPIMINKVAVAIPSEVMSGMRELIHLHYTCAFLFLNALSCRFLLILCAMQFLLMNSPLLIAIDNKDCFVPLFLISSVSPKEISETVERHPTSFGLTQPVHLAGGSVVACER